ncbi:hypothetical protein OLMES_1624 [Oleiphilus messinensis]|uniref:Uncharacterized protein n=1 Tax=Oleiphilus messinensis TaxID=141451 RepID=A0A1Y0I672_9GAMM|nr:Ig-like domain-containing protein [Oleiphilus messinensis]ARU55699.1 hypothetical protein OLMES_1624 [Oleiphilus messinensis]
MNYKANVKQSALVMLIGIATVSTAWALPPTEGEIIPGVGVPGVELGDTRAQVEQSYGAQTTCGAEAVGSSCYDIGGLGSDSAGNVYVRFEGTNGGSATGQQDDVVSGFSVYNTPIVGLNWTFEGGYTIRDFELQPELIQVVFPEAEIEQPNLFFTRYTDPQAGVELTSRFDPYGLFYDVTLFLSKPDASEEPGGESVLPEIRVSDIAMSFRDNRRNRHQVMAVVSVVDEASDAVLDATVEGVWTKPGGRTVAATLVTNQYGRAIFQLLSRKDGEYKFTINRVIFNDVPLNEAESKLMQVLDVR